MAVHRRYNLSVALRGGGPPHAPPRGLPSSTPRERLRSGAERPEAPGGASVASLSPSDPPGFEEERRSSLVRSSRVCVLAFCP
jgi:hypothetical protein